MTLKNVCNEDMKLKFTNSAGPPDLVYGGDPGIDLVKVVPVLSAKCRAGGSRVASQSVTITWTPPGCAFSSASSTFIAGAAVVQSSTSVSRVEGLPVLREGDASAVGCIGSWTSPGPVTVPCACTVEISDAGQQAVKSQ